MKQFEYKGHTCIIRKVLRLGTLCGYVVVPKHHPWHGMDYEEIECEVHGGLTYGQSLGEFDFAVGFDCAHYGDYVPGFPSNGDVYRDEKFVRGELEKVVEQMLEAYEDSEH